MDRVGTTTQSKILNIVKYYKFKQPETLNLKKCYEGNRGELLIIATVQYFVQLMLQIVSDQSENELGHWNRIIRTYKVIPEYLSDFRIMVSVDMIMSNSCPVQRV